jgi:hypothetical protein
MGAVVVEDWRGRVATMGVADDKRVLDSSFFSAFSVDKKIVFVVFAVKLDSSSSVLVLFSSVMFT